MPSCSFTSVGFSASLRKAFDPWEHAGLGKRSDLVEYCIPWRAAESERRFQPGWPMIQQIWQAMAEEAREHVRPLSFEKYQQILESLCPETGRLTPDLWYHWTKRAGTGRASRSAPRPGIQAWVCGLPTGMLAAARRSDRSGPDS